MFLGAHTAPNSVQMHTVNWRACVTASLSPKLSLRSNIASYCLCLIRKWSLAWWGHELVFTLDHQVQSTPQLPANHCTQRAEAADDNRSTRQSTATASEACPINTDLLSYIQIQLWTRHTRITALPNKLIIVPTVKLHFPSQMAHLFTLIHMQAEGKQTY